MYVWTSYLHVFRKVIHVYSAFTKLLRTFTLETANSISNVISDAGLKKFLAIKRKYSSVDLMVSVGKLSNTVSEEWQRERLVIVKLEK